jgi:prepilin-type N-terminal cleavage/methylation domain-containing protein
MTMRSNPSRSVQAPRRGFSFAEIMIAVAVAGIITMIAGPKLTTFRESTSVRSARQELTATIDAARAAALQRGRTARVTVRGDSAVAVVDTGPPGIAATGSKVVLSVASLRRSYGVQVVLGNPGDTAVVYDGRGMASPRLGRVAKYIVVLRNSRDSVCVSSLGNILPRECAP